MKKIKRLAYCALAATSVLSLGGWMPYNTAPAEDRYADAPTYSLYATETISFTSKQTDTKRNPAPKYTAITGMTNACGPVAGTEVIAYYDKYYENMIPDWQSYYPANGRYRLQDKVYVPSVMNELYTNMRTNVDGEGVTADEFLNGLTQYINGKGYSVSYQNVVSGSNIDYAACKTAINNEKVIVLLSRATDIYAISENTTHDTISSMTIGALHIMVASGYHEVSYYNGSTLTRTDKYLYGSSGSLNAGIVYYKVNPHSLNYAYIVNIS